MMFLGDAEMNVLEINVLVLAYLGDTVYERYIRSYLISLGINHVKDLQERAVSYVSAKRQAYFLNQLLESEFFSEEELAVIKRARNYKSNRHPKNCDILTYKHATALEAVIGYLAYLKREDRIEEIMDIILKGKKNVSIWKKCLFGISKER